MERCVSDKLSNWYVIIVSILVKVKTCVGVRIENQEAYIPQTVNSGGFYGSC